MSWQIRVPQGESRGINGAPPPPPPPPPLVYTAGSNRQIEDQCKSMETTLEIRVWINGRACPTWSRDYITPIGNASWPGTEDLPRPKLSHFWRSPPWWFTVSSASSISARSNYYVPPQLSSAHLIPILFHPRVTLLLLLLLSAKRASRIFIFVDGVESRDLDRWKFSVYWGTMFYI